MKQWTVIGLTGLALVATPASANQTSSVAGAVAVAVAAALGCWGGVMGADEDEAADAYDRRGFMLTANGSYNFEDFDDKHAERNRLDVGDDYDSWDETYGIGGSVGYRCHPRFSVETGVDWLDDFDSDISKVSNGTKTGSLTIEPVVVTTNVKGYILTGRYQPWLRIGSGFMYGKFTQSMIVDGTDDDRKTRLAWRGGGGLDFYATENVVLQINADYVMTPSLDLNFVTIGGGLQYRF